MRGSRRKFAISAQKRNGMSIRSMVKFPKLRRNTIAIALTVALFVFVVPSIIFVVVRAATPTMTQSNWAGGQNDTEVVSVNLSNVETTGTSTKFFGSSNIITDTANTLLAGPTTESDWCNTGTCDNNYPYRQEIFVDNTGNEITNANIKFTLAYKNGMNADFDDIRFVNAGGDTDLMFRVNSKTDSTSADVTVLIPTLPATSRYKFFVYYGKAGDSSKSIAEIKYTSLVTEGRSGYACGLNDNHKVYCWGNGGMGQLGNGSNTNVAIPVAVSAPLANLDTIAISQFNQTVCALTSTHKVYCWGKGSAGQLGNGSSADSNIPVAVSAPLANLNVTSIYSGSGSNCAITDNGKIYCWGLGSILGDGIGENSNIPKLVGGSLANKTAVSMTIADSVACALTDEGKVYCWGGYGSTGQLGNGTDNSITASEPVAVINPLASKKVSSIYGTSNSFCALTDEGQVYCWGENSTGSLGNGTFTNSNIPVAVSMTGALSGKTFKSVSTGKYTICAIASDDKAYCWGNNFIGQVGDGTQTNRNKPTPVNTKGVLSGKNISSIHMGSYGTCAITSDQDAYCWGIAPGDGGLLSLLPVKVKNDGAMANKKFADIIVSNSDEGILYCAIAQDASAYCWTFRDQQATGLIGNGLFSVSTEPAFVDTFSNISTLGKLFGLTQYINGASGNLTSSVFHFDNTGSYFVNALLSEVGGDGDQLLQIRSSSTNTMESDADWAKCNYLNSGDNIYSSTCVHPLEKFIQYRVYLSTKSTDAGSAHKINNVGLEFNTETTAPTNTKKITIKFAEKGSVVSDSDGVFSENGTYTGNGWGYMGTEAFSETGEAIKPYITWDAATDEGSGIGGYCLYLGPLATALPTDESNLLKAENSPINTSGLCPFAVSATTTSLDLRTAITDAFTLVSTNKYHFIVQPFDKAGTLSEPGELGLTKSSFIYESSPPTSTSPFSGPSGITNSRAVTFNWTVNPSLEWGIEDSLPGLAGIKYCSIDPLAGEDPETYCNDPEHWFGPDAEEGGIYNLDDVSDVSQGNTSFSTSVKDLHINNNGINAIMVGILDKSGNFTIATDALDTNLFLVTISQQPPTIPTSLAVSPTGVSSTNQFSFNWQPPQEFVGDVKNIDYCYTINEKISADGKNCKWTGKGITQLAAGPYATKQNENILYLMAKNEAGNYDTSKYASVTFITDTSAPGSPENLEIIDASTRATSAWKLALTWSPPLINLPGTNAIDSYRVLRSTDGINFDSIDSPTGRTSAANLSFIDSGLSQQTYYYKVVACDNANECSVASDIVNKYPTGKYTEPAKLTSDTDQPKEKDLSTKKITLFWFTDRECDSKISFGTSSKHYLPEEIGNSIQTSNHSVTLHNLQPGTKYYYVAKWTDQDGNTGVSSEKTFTTLPAPSISEVNVDRISIASGSVDFTVENASKVNIYFGKSELFGGAMSINTSSSKSMYSFGLTGLDDGTKYYYKLNGFDSDGNEYPGNVYSFTTLARPKISNLRFQPVVGASSNTTKVSWTTNVPASSELSYGVVGGKTLEVLDSKLATDHELTLSGLEDDKNYSLTARSRDGSGNLAVSDTQTFKTALDTRPPKVSNIIVESSIKGSGAEARGQVVVSWTTDEPSTSQVAYGQGAPGSYSNKTSEDSRLSNEHVVIISDLATSSIFQVQTLSKDKAANEAKGTNQSAIIGRGSEDVFTIIFSSLRKIFGLRG